MDGACEARGVGEVGEAGARELGYRGVRVVSEEAQGVRRRRVDTAWLRLRLRGGGDATAGAGAGSGGGGGGCSIEAGAGGLPSQFGA